MPIVHSDRISGTIYVISTNAENARDRAIEYLGATAGDPVERYGVFDEQADADGALHNRYGSHDTARDRVYTVSLDVRIADEK
jgi:hypothetical protein